MINQKAVNWKAVNWEEVDVEAVNWEAVDVLGGTMGAGNLIIGQLTIMGMWQIISKIYFSASEPPGVSERMWSVNLEASIPGEYQTIGGHSGRPLEWMGSLMSRTGVTEISDDCYTSTVGVIVISLGTRPSAGENFGYLWEYQQTDAEITNRLREMPRFL